MNGYYYDIDKGAKEFNQLPDEVKKDLLEWYNVREPDFFARQQLRRLYQSGRFRAWDCPECGTRCYVGEPKDWRYFQGVWQSETIGELCADCSALYMRLKDYADL